MTPEELDEPAIEVMTDPIMIWFGVLQAEAYANGHKDIPVLIRDLFKRKLDD